MRRILRPSTRRQEAYLRWRGKHSLGWVPFKNQTVRVAGSTVHFNGHKVRLWLHRPIEGRIKSGSFSQDARGRWYCNLVVEYEPKLHGKNAEVGSDLGLKDGMTLSTGVKVQNSRIFAKYEASLAVAQRAKKRRRVASIHAKKRWRARRDLWTIPSTSALRPVPCVDASAVRKGRKVSK